MSISIIEIFKATRLTKGGRLTEATRLIQRALGLVGTPKAKRPSATSFASRSAAYKWPGTA